MDSGWSKEPDAVSDPNRAIVIKSRRIGRIVVGTVERFMEPLEPGFWFFSISGTNIHLSGKW